MQLVSGPVGVKSSVLRIPSFPPEAQPPCFCSHSQSHGQGEPSSSLFLFYHLRAAKNQSTNAGWGVVMAGGGGVAFPGRIVIGLAGSWAHPWTNHCSWEMLHFHWSNLSHVLGGGVSPTRIK